jgi:hypothetical protein
MPDPFDTLRGPIPEAEPPEPFSTELRERYLRELSMHLRTSAGPAAGSDQPDPQIRVDQASEPRTNHRRALLLAAAALVIVVLASAAAIGLDDERPVGPAPGPGASTSTTATGPVSPAVAPLSDVGTTSTTLGNGNWVAAVGGWVAVIRFERTDDLEILDAATLERRHLLTDVGLFTQGAFGSFWVFAYTDAFEPTPSLIRRIDPASGEITATIDPPAPIESSAPRAIDDTGMWVAIADQAHSIVHISAETNKIDRTLKGATETIASLTYEDGSLWAIGRRTAFRLDPTQGTTLATVALPAGRYEAADVHDDVLWIYGKTDAGDVVLHRVDTVGNRIIGSTTVSSSTRSWIYMMAIAGDTIWCGTDEAAAVAIDPRDGAPTGRFGPNDGSAVYLATDAETTWLVYKLPGSELHRIPAQ